MQSSRDSSVWRSLAVAFGDGLAFGVGMKLTQPSGRASVAAPEPDISPLALRLEQVEQRIQEMETPPRTLTALEKAVPNTQPFDQKVLEAVVNALDARLRENSSQVERQITELQAKITIELKTLHQQDRSIADGLQTMIEDTRKQADEQNSSRVLDLQEQFSGQLNAIRAAAQADRQSMHDYLSALRHEIAALAASGTETRNGLRAMVEETRAQSREQVAALGQAAEADRESMREYLSSFRQDVAGLVASGTQASVEQLRAELREEMREATGRMSVIAASAAHSAIESSLAPLRAAVEVRDREIADLRARLAGSDQTTLDLLHSVGEICRRAAQRIVVSEPPAPPAPAAEVEPERAPPAPTDEASETDSNGTVPGFAQSKPPGKLWRVPLVSSLILTSGAMLMLHYL